MTHSVNKNSEILNAYLHVFLCECIQIICIHLKRVEKNNYVQKIKYTIQQNFCRKLAA